MATWPALLPRPSFDGYALDPLEQAIRTDMESGSPRNRRRSKARNDRINVTWRLTDREMMIFRAWFEYDGGAAGGTAWFDILLAYGDLGLKTRECRFSGVFKSTLTGGMNWTVTAGLEVRGGELTADQMRGAVLGLVSAEGVFPTLTLDFAADLALDSRIIFARASVATYFDAAGIMRTAALNVARFDHHPLTLGSLGLLLEETRTNYFANASTFAGGAVVSIGTATGPDGLLAYKVVPNAGAVVAPSRGSSAVQLIPLTTTEGQTTDVSLTYYFAPFGPLNYQPYLVTAARTGGVSSTYALISFNAADGTFTSKALNTGWTELIAPAAVMMPCGMWRVTWSVRWTQPATLKDDIIGVFQILNEANIQTYTADGVSGVQYACMQMEVGAFPTSYIQTTTAPATRAAESATISGAAFSSWHSQVASTFMFSGDVANTANDSAADVLFGLSGPGGFADTTYITKLKLTGAIGVSMLTGGVTQASHTLATVAPDTPFSMAIAYTDNSEAATLNGGVALTDSLLTPPMVDKLRIGSAPWAAGSYVNGHVARLVYWPARLPDAELRSFTLA